MVKDSDKRKDDSEKYCCIRDEELGADVDGDYTRATGVTFGGQN